MRKLSFVVVIVVFTGYVLYINAQHRTSKLSNKKYNQALQLYDLENPSEKTDSQALRTFLIVAKEAIAAGEYNIAADCFIKAGNIHQTYKRFDTSGQLYHQALGLLKKLKDDKLHYEAMLYLGSAHYFNNILDSARLYFELASDIAMNYSGSHLPAQDILYNSLGAIYFESANYLQAKNYFEKALAVSSPDTDNDFQDALIGINSNIANCLQRLNQFDSALSIYKKLLTYNAPGEIMNIIKQNTAHTYFQLGQFDTALAIYKSLPAGNILNRIKALNDMGRIYMNRMQWQKSEIIFDSAIALNKRISSAIRNKDEAFAYLYRGQLADKQGLTDEAITWCNEALQEVHMNFRWKGAEDLPELVSQTVSPITLFEILRTKAYLLHKKFKSTLQTSFLKSALKTYRKAIETANFIKANFDNDEAKLFFNQNYQPIYSEAIEVAFEFYKTKREKSSLNDYIYILENYKGTVLYQNLQKIQLKSLAKVPDSIKAKEKTIKELIAVYTSRINNNAAETEAAQLQKKLSELHVELSRLQKKYENDDTYNLFRNQLYGNYKSLNSIQSNIDQETALISYFISDSLIYILAINKNDTQIEVVPNDSTLKSHFNFYLNELYHPTEGIRYNGHISSVWLYNSLVKPVESIIASRPKWVFIPSSFLYYLPFETLEVNKYKREYLILSKTVSYHYSFALLFQNNTHHIDATRINYETAGFAPYSENDSNIIRSNLLQLPYSNDEFGPTVKNVYVSSKATKIKFLSEAHRFSLIHLATHASAADSVVNWIQFYPDITDESESKLFVQEIYNLYLPNTDLIILSACETAGGSTTYGEGLLSLSRAFMYAGSDGVISTLWKTEDKISAFLMTQFHKYLQQPLSVEKALQMAKIDLLKNKSIGSQYKTPNYWGNFIYLGKITRTNNKSDTHPKVLILFIVLAVFILLRKRFYSASK